MKSGNLLFSAVQFLFVVVIMMLGVFFIGLQHASYLHFAVVQFLSQQTFPFSLIGFLILGCGALLLYGFYAMHRGWYYTLNMGRHEALVDLPVIQGVVREYWKTVFPEQDLTIEVNVTKEQKIEMFMELPLLTPEKQLKALEKAQLDLSDLLQKHLGYRKDFSLSVLVK
jgi:hypothetical protein